MSRIKNRLSYLILGQKGGQNRIQIIELLRERPYNVNQIADILDLNYRTVQYHIDVLLKNELLNSSRTGGYGEVYFLSPEMEGNMELFEDIVNKFNTSKKLKDFTTSPRFYRSAMEQINDAITIIDGEGQVSFWNKSAERLYGYKEKEILGESIPIFPDKKTQANLMNKARKGKKVVGFETKGKHKSGELLDISITMDGIKDENENIIGFSILSRDITKRKIAEEALRESEELHRITLSSISDTVLITDRKGRFTYICPNIDFIFGYKVKEVEAFGNISKLLGKNLFDPKELKRSGEIKNIEIYPYDKSGKKHTLLMNVKKVSIKGGTMLYTCRDISRRKQVEDALLYSYERYALAQRAANIGSWDWDILTGNLTWSDTIEPMFGFETGKFGATYEAFLDCVHPEDRQYVIDSVDSCVKDGEYYNIEHRIVWPDGTVRWVSETGDVIRDEKGEGKRMLGIVQDITLRKQAEEHIRYLDSLLLSIKDIGQIIGHESDLKKLMQKSCDILIETRDYMDISIALLDDELGLITPMAHCGSHKRKSWKVTPDGKGKAPKCVKSLLKSASAEIIDSTVKYCKKCQYCEHEEDHRSVLMPMLYKNSVVGIMVVCFEKTHEIDVEDVDLLKEIAKDLAFARAKIQAERQLQESEETYHTTFNTSPDLLYRVSPDGIILDCNDTAIKTLGYKKEDLIGSRLFKLYAQESKAFAKECFNEWLKTGKLRNKVLKIITADGKKMDIELNVNTIYDSKGNVASSISSQRIIGAAKKDK